MIKTLLNSIYKSGIVPKYSLLTEIITVPKKRIVKQCSKKRKIN